MRMCLCQVGFAFVLVCSSVTFADDDFAALQKKANGGDAEAMCELGRCYRNGIGTKVDKQQADAWTQKAASNGCVRAVGLCYQFGYGVATNMTTAVQLYRKAAEKDDTLAMRNLGVCYAVGTGVEKDCAMAVWWYRKAADRGDAVAMCALGNCHKLGTGVEKDGDAAVELYRKAAEKGDARAMLCLGHSYEEGVDVVKDMGTAVNWYRKAAEKGDAEAMFRLGVCYEDGRGVSKNSAEAVRWYRNSADAGDTWAMRELGRRYMLGKGMPKDIAEGKKWYSRAAGIEDAPMAVEKEEDDVAVLVKKASDGDARAMFQLGVFMRNQNDLATAKDWLKKAVAANYPRAYFELAAIAAQDGARKEEVELLRSGADCGDTSCKFLLGKYYLQGHGVMKDTARGKELIEDSANGGDVGTLRFIGGQALSSTGYKGWNISSEKANVWFVKLAAAGDDYGKFQSASYRFYHCKDLSSRLKTIDGIVRLTDSQDDDVRALSRCFMGDVSERMDDLELALVWYEHAAEAGSAEGLRDLETLERKLFDAETRAERKKERMQRGIGSVKDILEEAKRHENDTLTFKGYFLGMSVEAAYRLLVKYDPDRRYIKTEKGLQDSEEDNPFDYPSRMVVKADHGRVTEFVFSRRLIDLIFGAEGKSTDQFASEIVHAYPIVKEMKSKKVLVPDWLSRNTQGELAVRMQGAVTDTGPAGAIQAAMKFSNAKRMITEMKKPGICYYHVSDKGFVLEITPDDGKPKQQVKYFVLKKQISE